MLASYTQIFMPALGNFATRFFPIFLLGAIFGKLMEDSGSAKAIAKGLIQRIGPQQAPLAIVASCGLLTYGGVSAFVVAFAVYPLAAAAFREADVPKRLIPGAIALGAFTFALTALPGAIQVHNVIPTQYFGHQHLRRATAGHHRWLGDVYRWHGLVKSACTLSSRSR